MGDFYQNGVITTIHRLGDRSLDDIEAELCEFNKQRPMCLVLPSLYSELQTPALAGIVEQLAKVPYLSQIIVGIDRANEDEYRHALEYFSVLPQDTTVLWNEGPRLQAIDQQLKGHDLAPLELGKGRNVWYCFGYALASGRCKSVALHDCDIVTYDRGMLARLLYPVANPTFGYKFCKGFYSRVAEGKMNGRVCRLLVTPLIRALKRVCGHSDYLEYLDSFRYPLAGEFSLQMDVVQDLRIPHDWGLEMGVISEMQRNFSTARLCQIDIADTYDHKHQIVSAEDASRGLSKMSVDIAKSLFRKLATQGQVFTPETFRSIKATYYRVALDLSESYHTDAVVNGLAHDRHQEEAMVELFAENIINAGDMFLNKPMETPFMPSWNRVTSAVPGIQQEFIDAVAADMQEYGA